MITTEPTHLQRVLGRAIDISGGQEELASVLGCTLADIGRWYSAARMPDNALLATLEIVTTNRAEPVSARLAALHRKVSENGELVTEGIVVSRINRQMGREAVANARALRAKSAAHRVEPESR